MSRTEEKEVIFTRIPKRLKQRFILRCIRIEKKQEQVITDLVSDWLNTPLRKK